MPRHRQRARLRRVSPLWLALPLVLMVATRGDTRDTSHYIEVFYQTVEFPSNPFIYYAENGLEWGFGLISWIFLQLGLGPTSLFVVVSAATFFFLNGTARRLGLGFYEVMPYYLGSFFLSQQLMQMRQGLGVAFAFWVIVRIASGSGQFWRSAFSATAASLVHLVSLAPLLASIMLGATLPPPRRWRVALWALSLIVGTALLARAASSLALFDALERLSSYAMDDEYGSARELFAPANLRAVLLLVLLLLACAAKQSLMRSRVFLILMGLYAIHIGIRLGFLDFQILSGRLSTAVGFGEVFLLPLAVVACVQMRAIRVCIGIAFFVLHAVATLTLQTPFLIDDYFTPLHAGYAPS